MGKDPSSEQSPVIGVISDTHGILRPEAVSALEGVDLIVHAGDIDVPVVLEGLEKIAPVHAVLGNMDPRPLFSNLSDTAVVEVAGRSLYVLHDLYRLDLEPAAAGFDVVIFGHSHLPLIEDRDGVLFVNPGSAGPRRFGKPVSVARLVAPNGRLTAQIIELAL